MACLGTVHPVLDHLVVPAAWLLFWDSGEAIPDQFNHFAARSALVLCHADDLAHASL